MVSTETFRELALSFPGATEHPHFDRRAFKAKKIFATLHENKRTANFVFSLGDQQEFCSLDATVVYPVPNKFGLAGWTTIELDKAAEELVLAALEAAYNESLKSKSRK
ncbi:MAG: MmcQ/YjbR family DNA-binding protein [Phycisphaerae bacterium]|nr:MmcQ/YjbR family DNA-binding protein [Saprospiraceae bacterium]